MSHTKYTSVRRIAALRTEKRTPSRWYNPQHKTRPMYRPRKMDLVRGNDGLLHLYDRDYNERTDRPVSTDLRDFFLERVSQHAETWQPLDRSDAFAEGAVVIAYFKGEGRTTLQLHTVPGILTWRQLRQKRIGAVERSTRGLCGARQRLSLLGGDSGPMLRG